MESVVMVNATTRSFFFLSLFFFFSIPLASADHTMVVADRETTEPSTLLPLPRKLRLFEEVASIEVHRNNKGDHPRLHDDKMHKEEDGASTSTGKSFNEKKEKDEGNDEEGEGIDTAQYYTTMDYSRVRKRRPIHNKSLPSGP